MKLPKMRGGGGIFRPKIEGEKSLWQLICGNGIAEMGGKKIVAVDLWQCCCQNGREKKCGNGERERERVVWIKKLFWILILKSTHILILFVC